MSNGREFHHWVPAFLSRNFAGPDGCVFFFDRDHSDVGVKRVVTKRAFRRSGLYTAFGTTKRNDAVERAFQRIESKTAPIVDRLIDAARSGVPASLSEAEFATWATFLYLQFRRTPDLLEEVEPPVQFAEFVRKKVGEYEQAHGLSDEERAMVADPNFAGRMRHNAFVQFLARPNVATVEIMCAKGLVVGVPQRPKQSFILGSRPIFRSGGHLSEPRVEIMLPLAPDVVAGIGGEAGHSHHVIADMHTVRRVNETIAKRSRQIASPSISLIESLTRRRPTSSYQGTHANS